MPDQGVVLRRRRRRIVGVAAVCAVVGAGTLALVGATDTRAPDVAGGAARFLPADGAVSWSQLPGGVAQAEQRLSPGIASLFVLPETVYDLAAVGYSDDARSVPHWATYWGPEAGRAGGNPRDVYSLTQDGIRSVASVGFPLDSVFVPGILVLPADVAPASSGRARARARGADCARTGRPSSRSTATRPSTTRTNRRTPRSCRTHRTDASRRRRP